MSCCGNKRESLKQSSSSQNSPLEIKQPIKMWNDVVFEYTGSGVLVVKGSVTGVHYQFKGNGFQILIDYKDAAGMRGEPLLKKVN